MSTSFFCLLSQNGMYINDFLFYEDSEMSTLLSAFFLGTTTRNPDLCTIKTNKKNYAKKLI